MRTAKFAIPLVVLGLVSVSPVLADDGPGAAAPGPHHWQMPSKEEMAAWHKQRCDDHYAHAAGRLAYEEAKLDVTGAQRPLFDSWRDSVLHNAQARKDSCLAHQGGPGEHVSVVERTARMEKRLEERLAALRSEQPALDALYQSLTPEQKVLLDEHRHHFGDRHGDHHGGPMDHRDMGH